MIFDRIENIKKYKGLCKELDNAIEFILREDLTKIPMGSNTLRGDSLAANVMTYETQDVGQLKFENHYRYMDLHVILKGTEIFMVGLKDKMKVIETYNKINDSEFLLGDGQIQCKLETGMFAVCNVGEPHLPGVATDVQQKVKKVVFKIRISE